MECDSVEELLVAYVKRELPAGQTALVEEHLALCTRCSARAGVARKALEVLEAARQPDVLALVRNILALAFEGGASDIHLQPERDEVRVRLRVDGVLHDVSTISREAYPAVVARLHTMGDSDPFETRAPQSSRISVHHSDRDYDLRVSVIASCWGQHVTMRILPEAAGKQGLEAVDFSPTHLILVRNLLRRPCGLLLVAGPAGAGRTTTMYACLEDVNSSGVAVFTVEDPVTMVIDGITQVHVDRRGGMDYAGALRAFLRSDPDVIMVDEVCDGPTVAAAVDLARTGHLVLAGFHAGDAAGAVERLLSLGLEPYIVAETLVGVVAQRLVRRICEQCKTEYDVSAAETDYLRSLGIAEPPARLWRGTGCDNCRQTGYRGRMAIHEVLVVDHDLAEAIASGSFTDEMTARALPVTSARDGADKALQGVTDLAEVIRVTGPRA